MGRPELVPKKIIRKAAMSDKIGQFNSSLATKGDKPYQ